MGGGNEGPATRVPRLAQAAAPAMVAPERRTRAEERRRRFAQLYSGAQAPAMGSSATRRARVSDDWYREPFCAAGGLTRLVAHECRS